MPLQEMMPPEPGSPEPILSCVNRILDGARLKNVPSELGPMATRARMSRAHTDCDLKEAVGQYEAIVYHRKNKARKEKQLKKLDRCLSLVRSEKWPTCNGKILTLDSVLSVAED